MHTIAFPFIGLWWYYSGTELSLLMVVTTSLPCLCRSGFTLLPEQHTCGVVSPLAASPPTPPSPLVLLWLVLLSQKIPTIPPVRWDTLCVLGTRERNELHQHVRMVKLLRVAQFIVLLWAAKFWIVCTEAWSHGAKVNFLSVDPPISSI